MSRLKALPHLQGDQLDASDPQVHAALSASAGTGKTQVLTARVLRLLLGGARPESILCLTFTKAGAAEMANRIGARLAAWVRIKDSELKKELFALGERDDPLLLQQARRLFARVLDAPGGLKIQTIHSFAQSLLASFPAEAGIVPGFQPIEGRAEQELVRRTLAELLAEAEEAKNEALIGDVQCLSRRLGETGAVEYLKEAAASHEALAAFGAPQSMEPTLRRLMGLPEESVEEYLAAHCGDDSFDCELLRAVARVNRAWGTSTGAGHADVIDEWLAHPPAVRAATLDQLARVVFKADGERRKVSAGQIKAEPGYEAHADALAEAVAGLIRIQRGARLAETMAAGLRAGQAFAAAYTRAKRSAGAADFDDLIAWTRQLLARPGMGDWVRYKLDRQVDHILVDEAQDTNAAQWEIIERLVEEFFSGASEAERRWRTLFLVGDFKQAIYGFQGTDPREFERARGAFRERADALRGAADTADEPEAAREFRDLSIAASFRSSQAVLDVVDSVIGIVGPQAMGLRRPPPAHRAHHAGRPGEVELWQPFALEQDEDGDEGEESWIALNARRYAEAIAEQVRRWIAEAPRLASTGRPLTAGDILVLVRSRGELASLLVARLFAKGVPVAGIDRLHLQEPLAVQDLLAAIRFAVQPNDDLSLANLLVSPLFGWDQDQLLDLAHGRSGSLWRQLRDRAEDGGQVAATYDALRELLNLADYAPPSRFLETILSGPMHGRRKLYARLGLEARDPIDELMNSALEFERGEAASLDRFLAWFSRGDVEIQRDPAAPANQVRVMTVHGAKGLEAPVVLLADSTADPAKLGRTPLTLDFDIPGMGSAPLLRPRKDELCYPFADMIARAEQSDLEEHWRLLYVGLTRGADRLVVAGVEPKRGRPENCWHRHVEAAMQALGAEGVDDPHWGPKLVWRGSVRDAVGQRSSTTAAPPPPAVPQWALEPAPPEARPPRPLAPSAIAEDRESTPLPSEALRAAARRGTLIHHLLDRLAEVAASDRHRAALRWLEHSGGLDDGEARREIADTVCAVLDDPRYAPLFGAGSLAEAPLAAALPDGRVVAGTVDRLLVEADAVSVVDFKTGRVPESDEAIPAAHRAQMEAYREALRVIFPGRGVRAALLYTGGPRLFDLDG